MLSGDEARRRSGTNLSTRAIAVAILAAPQLNFESFEVKDTKATHVQLRVISNQCTGTPAYQGEQDADPNNNTDCDENSEQGEIVRAAELEVFSK